MKLDKIRALSDSWDTKSGYAGSRLIGTGSSFRLGGAAEWKTCLEQLDLLAQSVRQGSVVLGEGHPFVPFGKAQGRGCRGRSDRQGCIPKPFETESAPRAPVPLEAAPCRGGCGPAQNQAGRPETFGNKQSPRPPALF